MNIDDLDHECCHRAMWSGDQSALSGNDCRVVNVELLALDDQSWLQREENDRASRRLPRRSRPR